MKKQLQTMSTDKLKAVSGGLTYATLSSSSVLGVQDVLVYTPPIQVIKLPGSIGHW